MKYLYIAVVVFIAVGFIIFLNKKNNKNQVQSEFQDNVTDFKGEDRTVSDNVEENISNCIGEIVDLIALRIGNEKREINPRDALLCAGNLTGLFMFESFDFKTDTLEPGSIMLSEEANQLGQRVTAMLLKILDDNYGLMVENPDSSNIYKSRLSYIDILQKVQKPAEEIMNKYKLTAEQKIVTCIHAAAFTINNVRSNVRFTEGFSIVLSGIIEGSKTVPLN